MEPRRVYLEYLVAERNKPNQRQRGLVPFYKKREEIRGRKGVSLKKKVGAMVVT